MRDSQQQVSRPRSGSKSSSRQHQSPEPRQQPQQAAEPEASTYEVFIQRPLEHVSSFFSGPTTTPSTITSAPPTASPVRERRARSPSRSPRGRTNGEQQQRSPSSRQRTYVVDKRLSSLPPSPPPRSPASPMNKKYAPQRTSTKTLRTMSSDGGSFSSNDSLPTTKDIENHGNTTTNSRAVLLDNVVVPAQQVDPVGSKNITIRRLRCQRCVLLLVIFVLAVLAATLGGLLSVTNQKMHSSSSTSSSAAMSSNNNNDIAGRSQPGSSEGSPDSGSANDSANGQQQQQQQQQPEDSQDFVPLPAPAPVANPAPAPGPSTSTSTATNVVTNDPCGCPACTQEIWNRDADSFTCGERITWLHETFPLQYMTQQDACRRIAFEFPCVCGGCDPARCNWIPETPFLVPAAWKGPDQSVLSQLSKTVVEQLPATVPDLSSHSLYCFPDIASRAEYTMWGGMKVQVKRDPAGNACGPGNNIFQDSTVAVNGDELTLKYTNGKASEVRVLLPEAQRPYTYGNYGFSVKSILVKNANGQVISTQLPKELVLGIFTWDDTEDYASHQNYNHEVDVEISRWNCETNADVQFLVQPPGAPQQYRFFSGEADATDMAVQLDHSQQHWYNFTWLPGRINWSSTAGQGAHEYSLTTEEALYKGVTDYVQCMPGSRNVEVRLNLWNMLGSKQPVGLSPTDVVEVVFDKFSFERSSQTHLNDGEFCSKSCQCDVTSRCINAQCTKVVS